MVGVLSPGSVAHRLPVWLLRPAGGWLWSAGETGWQPWPVAEEHGQHTQQVLTVIGGGLQVGPDGGEGFCSGEAVEGAGDLPMLWRFRHSTAYGSAASSAASTAPPASPPSEATSPPTASKPNPSTVTSRISSPPPALGYPPPPDWLHRVRVFTGFYSRWMVL